jgi:hypothetical protein
LALFEPPARPFALAGFRFTDDEQVLGPVIFSPPWPLAGPLCAAPLSHGATFCARVRSMAPWAWSRSLDLDGAPGVRPFAVLLLPAGGRTFPSGRAHMSLIERPSRSVFIGRSAASFALRPPLELEATADRGRSIRLLGFAPAGNPYRAAAFACCRLGAIETALGFSSLRLADIQRTDVPHAGSTSHGPPAPKNRFRFLSAPGFVGNDRDDSAQTAAAGYISTLPALQRF